MVDSEKEACRIVTCNAVEKNVIGNVCAMYKLKKVKRLNFCPSVLEVYSR